MPKKELVRPRRIDEDALIRERFADGEKTGVDRRDDDPIAIADTERR